jgi:hypothetical protein
MSLKPSYAHLDEQETDFTTELGWLAAIAFCVVMVVAALQLSTLI